MQQVDRLTFTFENNDRLHDDLVLRVGDAVWRADSYFLWCEDPRENAGPEVVRRALSRLVEQWIAAVRALGEGQSCFLPFDFSDECTAWLHCTLKSGLVLVRMGWSRIEGWSFSPSEVGELMRSVPDFEPNGFAATIVREEMLRSLAAGAAA